MKKTLNEMHHRSLVEGTRCAVGERPRGSTTQPKRRKSLSPKREGQGVWGCLLSKTLCLSCLTLLAFLAAPVIPPGRTIFVHFLCRNPSMRIEGGLGDRHQIPDAEGLGVMPVFAVILV